MSEFVDPIKNVKKKVKLLDEASKVIKSSLRQQLERQREIKGLEVAKTEEYAKQAKPIVEAVGTQPSEEEKKLAKENDRNIVISNLDLNKIPITDPSYNIILRYFDDSYDTIKNRKTDALKQRDINMMVSSIDSLLTVSVFGIPTPIGKLSKKIFEKIFLNKDFEITPEETKDIETHEQEIKDREKTQAEKSQAEAERKIEEEKKAIEEETKKREAEISAEEELRKKEKAKESKSIENTMYEVFKKRLKEQGINIEDKKIKPVLNKAFDFIHKDVIAETDDISRTTKIEELINNPALKTKIPNEKFRNRVKVALLRTYTSSVVKYVSTKSETEPSFAPEFSVLIGTPAPAPAPAPVEPPRPVRAISDEGFEDALTDEAPAPAEEKAPAPAEEKDPEGIIEGKTGEERINNYNNLKRTEYRNIFYTNTGIGYNIKNIIAKNKKFYDNAGSLLSKNDKIQGQIGALKTYVNDYLRKSSSSDIPKAEAEIQTRIKKLADLLDEKYNPLTVGYGLKKGKKQKGGFNFLSMFAPIPLVGNGQLTMEDLRTKTSSGIKKKLGLTKPEVLSGKGMTILNPKNFQKGMKKKANEDLLHNLQVHMAEVQAGNNNLKQPISMLVDEAVGRGIMKKQVGNKIKKHFVN